VERKETIIIADCDRVKSVQAQIAALAFQHLSRELIHRDRNSHRVGLMAWLLPD
jgi:hypothetical protein